MEEAKKKTNYSCAKHETKIQSDFKLKNQVKYRLFIELFFLYLCVFRVVVVRCSCCC